MRKPIKRFLIFKYLCVVAVIFMSICGFSASVAVAYTDSENADIYKSIDDYLNDVTTKANFPSLSIAIVDKETTLFSKSYGDCESPDVPYLLGSVSKSFTALSIMQLAEQGKIDLNAELSQYLPNATDGDNISIIQLLNHTSGLGEHQNLTNYKIVGKQGVHTYANVNYSLLGKVVEKVSGTDYASYVTDNIFAPLCMTKSFADIGKAKENGLIQGYESWFGINTKTNAKFSNSDSAWITTSAGYLSSSVSDLGKYLQMYLNGGKGIISADSINKMFYQGVEVEANIPYRYAMGWTLINEPLKQPALRHSGLVETGMSVVYILPESEIGIAIAVNTNDYFVGKDMMDRIDWGVVLMIMGDEPNQIGANEYVLKHLLYDFIYLLVFAIAVLPIFLIAHYKKMLASGKLWVKVLLLTLLHLILPVTLLLLPQIFFSTPLWVVKAFVPDMFTVIIVSACLLFACGIVKIFLLVKHKLKSV